MKKYLYIEADSNDADYIGRLYETTDEQLERFKPIFENANKPGNRSKARFDHGVPLGEGYWEDCNPGGIWEGVSEEVKEEFLGLIPDNGYDGYCYIISKIKVLTLEENILDYE